MDKDSALYVTPGNLIDSLITTDLKIWHFMEKESDSSLSEHERFEAGQLVIALNKKRNKLIEAINQHFGVVDVNPKTY